MKMRPISFKAVLFDLDGTLIDSEYFYYSNWAPILENNFGLIITFEDWINEFAGHTLVRNIHHLNERFNIGTTEEFMWKETRASYAKTDMTTISLMPYVKETLTLLKSKNIGMGLVTSSYRSTVDTVLGHYQLLEYFDFFVTRESVESPKPNPEPYLLGVEKLGLSKKDIVAVEDTITGVIAAKEAGLTCIAITKQSIERQRIDNKADFLLQDLKEFADSTN